MSITRAGTSVSFSSGTGQPTWTQSITIPAGTDCLVIKEANADGSGGQTPLSITVGGVAATLVPSSSAINGNYFETSIWLLLNPAPGTVNLVIDVNSTATHHNASFWFAQLDFLVGVDQATPTGTAATNNDLTTAGASVTATGGVTGDLYVGVAHVYGTTISSGGAPQTVESKQQNIGALTSASGDTITGSSPGAFTFTAGGSTSGGWATSAVVFKAAASSPTFPPVPESLMTKSQLNTLLTM